MCCNYIHFINWSFVLLYALFICNKLSGKTCCIYLLYSVVWLLYQQLLVLKIVIHNTIKNFQNSNKLLDFFINIYQLCKYNSNSA